MKRSAKRGDPRRAIGYIRVSTAEQKLGPRAQSEALELWSAREGVQLVACFIDAGISGATRIGRRKALLGALAALQSVDAGLLVAAKRDRFAREVSVAAAVEAEAARCGATVVTADGASGGSGAGGVLSRGMHDLIAQWECAVISERTALALAVKRARGQRVGGVPYGFRVGHDGKRLEPLESEQQVIALVSALCAAGLSTRAIVARLDGRGVRSRSGRPLRQTQVQRILRAATVAA
jgi:DNA invertase Pin-like site-specific DNA recombinase